MTGDTARRLTLLVPGLFDPPVGPAVRTPHLAALLARSDRLAAPAPGFEARLFALFGTAVASGQDLPVAAVTRLADMGVIDREWWVRADPVHLEPGRDRLVLQPVHLAPDEAASLVAELAQSLAPDGWLLRAPHPQRWYAKPPGAPALVTTPLSEALGHDIRNRLPRGADARAWHTRLSELQILLHTAAANAARETRGEPPANSVWFWGGGRLPEPGVAPWAGVWSDEPLALGLARLAGIGAQRLPGAVEAWLDTLAAGEHLVVFDGLYAARLAGAAERGPAILERLEREWIAPLRRAVHRGRLTALRLAADTGPLHEYRRWHGLRLWRRPQPLAGRRAA